MHYFRFSFLFLFVVFITYGGNGQTDSDKLFAEKGEVYFKFQVSEQTEIEHLTRVISIDHKSDKSCLFAYAGQKQFEKFLKLNIPYEILPHPGEAHVPLMKNHISPKENNNWDFYPAYEAYVEIMYQFEEEYPDLCDVFSIGTSIEGRQLLMAKISGNVGVEEGEARCLFTSTIHGDETTGFVLMLHLIDYLLTNYNSDDKVTHLVNNLEIWINPLANPDGTYAGGNNTIQGATRFNANYVDLNRNFPDPEDGEHPDGNPWQKETIEFMELADSVSFVLSANFHGGAEVFNYPWDTWPQLHADDDWWQFTGREWADTVHYYSVPGYFNDLNNGITNGYAWYSISGGRQDYMNYFRQCREVTLEISNDKMLPANQLPDYWEYNYRSFLNYFEQALYGIQGTVTDSISGEPVAASVFIEGHDTDNSRVGSDPLNGKYFRPLYQGVYDIVFSAPGYQSKTYNQVNITNMQQTTIDVELVYTGSGINDIAASGLFRIGPNPSEGIIVMTYLGNRNVKCDIKIINISGETMEHTVHEFKTGQESLTMDLRNATGGVYLIIITSDSFVLKEKVIVK